MLNRIRIFVARTRDRFWLVPATMVLVGVLGAVGLVNLDRSGVLPDWLLESAWLYNGGGTGARTLLGVVASSAIGVAGTVFSITIAALSLAAGQMGPRLLRNFTRDRGNQVTLGAFLGTFSYALMVLRSVRTQNEGDFVPHLSLSVGILLAFLCVATLVYFVNHMASRINVDTVIELVSSEMQDAITRLGSSEPSNAQMPWLAADGAGLVAQARRGYVSNVDAEALADWAAREKTVLRLLVRPGDYAFPGAPIAVCHPAVDDCDAVGSALDLRAERISADDIEYAVRQLVEVAVRALSPGINDPHTAMSALDRLGAALCDLVPLHLPDGLFQRDGRCVLVLPAVDYDGLTDAMFHLIRQNAAGSATVLIRMLEVLTAVASCERDPVRLNALQRHAALIVSDAQRNVATPSDLDDLRRRSERFTQMLIVGPLALEIGAPS
ncbi:MAG: DUF2254 domain-containing protein [Burkholderiaceae bacterium]